MNWGFRKQFSYNFTEEFNLCATFLWTFLDDFFPSPFETVSLERKHKLVTFGFNLWGWNCAFSPHGY